MQDALRDALIERDELVREDILEVIEKALANRIASSYASRLRWIRATNRSISSTSDDRVVAAVPRRRDAGAEPPASLHVHAGPSLRRKDQCPPPQRDEGHGPRALRHAPRRRLRCRRDLRDLRPSRARGGARYRRRGTSVRAATPILGPGGEAWGAVYEVTWDGAIRMQAERDRLERWVTPPSSNDAHRAALLRRQRRDLPSMAPDVDSLP